MLSKDGPFKLTILNFISGRNLGGSKQAFLDYSLMCAQLGHQVFSMIRTNSPLKELLHKMPPKVAENVLELNYIRLKWPGFKQWALREFQRVTANISPEVILVHKPIDLFFIRKTFPGAKIVAVVHSFTARHLQHADRVFAVSEALKNYIIAQGCKIPVSVINNAIEIPPVPTQERDREEPVIGTMAVFRRTKRLDLMIRSFHSLYQQGIPFRGVLAGAGIQKYYLKYLLWRFGLNRQVELRPWVMDKEAFYRDIDIFCISSKSETFSISLIEAMARKKAVVATSCGGPQEIIQDKIDGLLTPVGNAGALTDKFLALIKSREDRQELAQNAYRKVCQHYSTDVIKKKIDQQLNLLVTNGRKN